MSNTKKDIKKAPFLHKTALSLILNLLGDNPKAADFIYSAAVDEAGYNPNMVNKGNVLKAIFDYGRGNRGLLDSLGNRLQAMHLFPEHIYNMRYPEGKKEVLNLINRADKKYNVFKDDALPVIENVLDKGLLNFANLRNLYRKNYKKD